MKYSHTFQKLVLWSLLLNIMHWVEVSQTKFFISNPDFYPYTKYFESIPEAVYYVQHWGLYLVILVIVLFVLGKRWVLVPLFWLWVLNTLEVHHFFRAIDSWWYESWMVTSFLFLILSIFYRKEFQQLYRSMF